MRQKGRKTHEADAWFDGAQEDSVSLKNIACKNATLFESCGKYYNSATCTHNIEKPLGDVVSYYVNQH